MTELVALHICSKLSKGGCIIVHGCGMDMAMALQHSVYKNAYIDDEPEMFSNQFYKAVD